MTNKQQFIYGILLERADSEGNATVNIHYDLNYPMTPESINPSLQDLQSLQDNNKISSYERVSSRTIKVSGIN